MGLFSKGAKVQGWAQIVSTTQAPHNATSGMCRMNVVLQAEGTPAFPVEASKICRVSKWPHPGMRLPCEFDPNKPEKFDIDWGAVPSWKDQARQQTEMMAAQMNQSRQMNQSGPPGQPGAGVPGMTGLPGNVQVINLSGGEMDAAKIAKVEQMLGVDLDGDGLIGGPAPGAQPPPAAPASAAPMSADDRVAALERLAALHEKGMLTAEEFAAEKQRLLSS